MSLPELPRCNTETPSSSAGRCLCPNCRGATLKRRAHRPDDVSARTAEVLSPTVTLFRAELLYEFLCPRHPIVASYPLPPPRFLPSSGTRHELSARWGLRGVTSSRYLRTCRPTCPLPRRVRDQLRRADGSTSCGEHARPLAPYSRSCATVSAIAADVTVEIAGTPDPNHPRSPPLLYK